MTSQTRGILIAFEGIDGSGKTTQIKKVADYLRKRISVPIVVTHEPNPNSPYCQYIQKRVKQQREEVSPEQELEWYTKDRKWDLDHNILPALERNEIVLVDRYYMSSAAYQGALDAFTIKFVLEKNSFAKRPDLWVILDVDVQLGQSRLKQRDKRKFDQLEEAEYQEKVLENYKLLSQMEEVGGKISWVDASIGEEELTIVIGELILSFVKEFQSE
ncbi:MAG: dTMP kinase [Candidatus Hodarchaeales archaeon]